MIGTKSPNPQGKAYAIFDSSEAPNVIYKHAKDAADTFERETNSSLELSLEEMPEFLAGVKDTKLRQLFYDTSIKTRPNSGMKPKRMDELRYVLSAKAGSGKSEDAGAGLNLVMAYLHQTVNTDKDYLSQIVGQADDGHYAFWDND